MKGLLGAVGFGSAGFPSLIAVGLLVDYVFKKQVSFAFIFCECHEVLLWNMDVRCFSSGFAVLRVIVPLKHMENEVTPRPAATLRSTPPTERRSRPSRPG